MKETLKPGLVGMLEYHVPESKTVPQLYPESAEFRDMPKVFATGYLVGLVEWACMRLINPHLEGPGEKSVGVDVRLTHQAATPPGRIVTVKVVLERVHGRRLTFRVTAHDGVDLICHGTHDRMVIDVARFNAGLTRKIA
jgi:fluoroacetyl-CoA thioesterase